MLKQTLHFENPALAFDMETAKRCCTLGCSCMPGRLSALVRTATCKLDGVLQEGHTFCQLCFSYLSFGCCLLQRLGPCCWHHSSLHVPKCSLKLPKLYGVWQVVLSRARMLLLHQVGCCTLVTNTYHQRHFSSGPMELLEQQPFAHCRCVKHDLLICALTQVKMCIASHAFVWCPGSDTSK